MVDHSSVFCFATTFSSIAKIVDSILPNVPNIYRIHQCVGKLSETWRVCCFNVVRFSFFYIIGIRKGEPKADCCEQNLTRRQKALPAFGSSVMKAWAEKSNYLQKFENHALPEGKENDQFNAYEFQNRIMRGQNFSGAPVEKH